MRIGSSTVKKAGIFRAAMIPPSGPTGEGSLSCFAMRSRRLAECCQHQRLTRCDFAAVELPPLARKFLRIGLLDRKTAKISVLLNLATASFVTRPILCVGATMKTPQPTAYNHKN